MNYKKSGTENGQYFTAIAKLLANSQVMFELQLSEFSDEKADWWRAQRQVFYYKNLRDFHQQEIVTLTSEQLVDVEVQIADAMQTIQLLDSKRTE